MFFSRITLRRDALTVAQLTEILQGDGYRYHQYVWDLFGGETSRDFIYRRIEPDAWPSFYIVSKREPVDSHSVWEIHTKTYRPKLEVGQRYSFLLTANAVLTRTVDGKQYRHDVVMDLKKRLMSEAQRIELPSQTAVVEQAGREWLTSRAQVNGFAVKPAQIAVDGYRQHVYEKGKQGSSIRLSSLDFQGILTIADPGVFLKTLYEGIGRAKGFGFGMLLIRPI
jgi:CRISPR system Cascade subunit CasE